MNANRKEFAYQFRGHPKGEVIILIAFLPLFALAQSNTKPCASTPKYAQFDFWIGEWDVTDQGKSVAHSSIQHIVESCIVFENYTQDDGYSGRSFNFIDGASGKWRQVWVDSHGNISEFTGEARDSGIYYEGETHFQTGRIVKRTMKLVPSGLDTVRQYSERSTDGGKTWGAAYDFLYLRRR